MTPTDLCHAGDPRRNGDHARTGRAPDRLRYIIAATTQHVIIIMSKSTITAYVLYDVEGTAVTSDLSVIVYYCQRKKKHPTSERLSVFILLLKRNASGIANRRDGTGCTTNY